MVSKFLIASLSTGAVFSKLSLAQNAAHTADEVMERSIVENRKATDAMMEKLERQVLALQELTRKAQQPSKLADSSTPTASLLQAQIEAMRDSSRMPSEAEIMKPLNKVNEQAEEFMREIKRRRRAFDAKSPNSESDAKDFPFSSFMQNNGISNEKASQHTVDLETAAQRADEALLNAQKGVNRLRTVIDTQTRDFENKLKHQASERQLSQLEGDSNSRDLLDSMRGLNHVDSQGASFLEVESTPKVRPSSAEGLESFKKKFDAELEKVREGAKLWQNNHNVWNLPQTGSASSFVEASSGAENKNLNANQMMTMSDEMMQKWSQHFERELKKATAENRKWEDKILELAPTSHLVLIQEEAKRIRRSRDEEKRANGGASEATRTAAA